MTHVTKPPQTGSVAAPGETARPEVPKGSGWRPRVWRSRRIGLGASALLLALLVGGLSLYRSAQLPALTRQDVDESVARGLEAQAQEDARVPADATVAWGTILPSLVLITTRGADGAGSGAGVVVNTDGLVLTALHVVEGSDEITVALPHVAPS